MRTYYPILSVMFFCSLVSQTTFSQTMLGEVIPNTNLALPQSYNFQEYVFPEPNDQGSCTGARNTTATIDEVFIAQTHRHSLDHPFYFTIGYRPALFQVAVSGSGQAPDVEVEGFREGNSIGKLCLKGPATLPTSIDLSLPDFDNYFSVTLPKNWVQPGLELRLTAGDQVRAITNEELKIGPYTEINLVMYEMDVLDYNTSPHNSPIIDNFIQESGAALPASVFRYGVFPERLKFPELVASNDTEQTVRLTSRGEMSKNGINSDGSINSVATLFIGNLHRATGDFLSTIYFGNTLNLAPGGWGGGHSFVSFDFSDVYIHELGHALSLPHWGESAFEIEDPQSYQYLYPYGGDVGKGGGRGETWGFLQHIYEFVNPVCQFDERGQAGLESSDAMQRNNHCLEKRSESQGPWDGFGDFSALAIHRYLVGGSADSGQVNYRGQNRDYQFNYQEGFPVVSMENGKRIYTRDPLQPATPRYQERNQLPGDELLNQDVYLIYGTTHPTQDQANLLYPPIKFKGTLPPLVDPTDPDTMAALKTEDAYVNSLSSPRDITLKMTYADGSVLHAINPWHSFVRPESYPEDYFNIWRYDLSNFALVVPGDKELVDVELYHRPFAVNYSAITGNVRDPDQNITAANFMDSAELKASYGASRPKKLGGGSIGNRVWYDLNQNGLEDEGEPGIADVSVLLWRDSDGDDVPDYMGFGGVSKTDANGYYTFGGLAPGPYTAFVWSVDNWDKGQPLNGMVSTVSAVLNSNNDIDGDNNACFSSGGQAGLGTGPCSTAMARRDIASGVVTLSADGEPLMDGDRIDDWFDFDPSGNMTIDFGFHYQDSRAFYTGGTLFVPSIAADNLNYEVQFELSNPLTLEFSVVRASELTDNSTTLGNFTDGKITIPRVTIQGIDYLIELTLVDSSKLIFRVSKAEVIAN